MNPSFVFSSLVKRLNFIKKYFFCFLAVIINLLNKEFLVLFFMEIKSESSLIDSDICVLKCHLYLIKIL